MFELQDVFVALGAEPAAGDGPTMVDDLSVDARRVAPGSVFFCVRGFGVDGHDWAPEAVANGAVAVVAERRLEVSVPQIVVPDARAALATVSVEYWGDPTETLPVVGITGTSGKTTTAYLIHSILEAAGLRPGLYSSIETQIGSERVPSPSWTPVAFHLQGAFRSMLNAGNLSCAIEATSHDSELRRLDGVHFAALVFTNLGHDHLDFHGTFERYFAAKRRYFLDGSPPAAVNLEDRYGRRLVSELRAGGHERLLTFGLTSEADLSPAELDASPAGTRLRLGDLELHTRLPGAFNVENVLAAVAAARLLEVPDEAIAAGVAALENVPGRMEPIDEGQPYSVFVDYAHKPEALEAALRTARMHTTGRVLCVFGCGGDCYRGKRPMMGRIAAALSDLVILTTDNPRNEDPQAIVDEIAGGGAPDEIELDRRRAIERAVMLARPGDVILVAGRGHETEQELAGGRILHFDDRDVVRDVLRSSGWC
ncbi:MAG TPA: UDP-N-acetylmuramoyl-L-alanyl-D-glutamate--2,6-diaminopimelate ligase [Gaiellaceae bacterium]|nr:UDP-N-acetylmuramoyl-L-alanyl-D-glutamate--2,6-diaminopimelate ligase [Gaiellaceae bacterium]